MTAALICGRKEEGTFAGRNTFPLMGRPMMVYPLLAARHAQYVDHIFVSTDSPEIARIAQHHQVPVIHRPPALQGSEAALEDIIVHGYQAIEAALEEAPELLVVLLANAPTVIAKMIDKAVAALHNDDSIDVVMTVSRRNEFHPHYALQLDEEGLLRPRLPLNAPPSPLPDVYFADSLLWAFCPERYLAARETIFPNWVVNCATQRVLPIVHDGYGDVDYMWQVPAIESWLRQHGFDEDHTPYDKKRAAGTKALPTPTQPPERRVLVTTVPFGEVNPRSLELLESNGIEYVINPLNRKFKEHELAEFAREFGVLIAGTEPITAQVMDNAPHLRLIARVGIGLDSVDLHAARERDIQVTYTPDAPSAAVAELTVGAMLSLLRYIAHTDRSMRNGVWYRRAGRRLADMTLGVIGVGRIGKRVIQHVTGGFGARVLANDLVPDETFGAANEVIWADKETIYKEADIITLHVPRTSQTMNLITYDALATMKPEALLINTSRGGIVNERDLARALREGLLGGAALDVYEREPYSGELAALDRCLLTSHMGSMTRDSRARMEIEAVEEAVRFLKGDPLRQPVPEEEYAR